MIKECESESEDDYEIYEGFDALDASYYYEKKYGKIVKAKFRSYYKYSFRVLLIFKGGKQLEISTGGDKDDIYRYDPTSTEWSEHCAADIRDIRKLLHPNSHEAKYGWLMK
jgi:hypothetical protein